MNTVKKIIQDLDHLSGDERVRAERALVADAAFQAAMQRPLDSVGVSSLYYVQQGLEEEALAAAPDIISITTTDGLEAALTNDKLLTLLIRSNASLSDAMLRYLLAPDLTPRTILIVQ